jgi:hypothetical protein
MRLTAREGTPITREEMEHWAAFQVPSKEEMKLFDRAITIGERPAS